MRRTGSRPKPDALQQFASAPGRGPLRRDRHDLPVQKVMLSGQQELYKDGEDDDYPGDEDYC